MDRGLQMAPDTLSMDGWETQREGEGEQTELFFIHTKIYSKVLLPPKSSNWYGFKLLSNLAKC